MTSAIRLLLSLALVAVVSSFGAGTPFGPDGAWAQTATDLKCNGCVNSKDIRKNGIRRNRIRNGAINLNKLEPGLGERADTTQPVYVTADTAGQTTITTFGPITIFMRCLINDAGFDRIQVFASASVDGWFTGDTPTGLLNNGPFTAGQEAQLDSASVATGTPNVNDFVNGDNVITPDGFMLTYADDTNIRALNALGHVCTYAGVFHRVRNTP